MLPAMPNEADSTVASTGPFAPGDIHELAETVDRALPGFRGHRWRVARIADLMAVESGWSDEDSDRLREAALLHDVGRVAVPWALLAREGELTADELASVREYTEIGAELLAQALDEQQLSWVASHLERWDGSGSPTGLAGREIPAGAQIIGIADTWDALTSARPHRQAATVEDALSLIGRARGTEFAPGLVNLFLRVLPKLEGGRRSPRPVPEAVAR